MIRLGYPTQNLTIPASTNRSLRLVNLQDTEKVKNLVRQNVSDLEDILRWNSAHGVGLFRMGQNLIPFVSHPEFPYDWEREHAEELREAGELAVSLGIRLSMHPGQYIQPGSLKPGVSERGVAELRASACVLTLLGAADGVLVLHLSGAGGDREAAAERFVESLRSEEETLRYLALENDEQTWSPPEVAEVAYSLGVPAITDTLHHGLNPGGLTLEEAVDLTLPIWESRGARPKLHISSQNPDKQQGAHSYSIDTADWSALTEAVGDREADVMVEAKGKEEALIPMGVQIG